MSLSQASLLDNLRLGLRSHMQGHRRAWIDDVVREVADGMEETRRRGDEIGHPVRAFFLPDGAEFPRPPRDSIVLPMILCLVIMNALVFGMLLMLSILGGWRVGAEFTVSFMVGASLGTIIGRLWIHRIDGRRADRERLGMFSQRLVAVSDDAVLVRNGVGSIKVFLAKELASADVNGQEETGIVTLRGRRGSLVWVTPLLARSAAIELEKAVTAMIARAKERGEVGEPDEESRSDRPDSAGEIHHMVLTENLAVRKALLDAGLETVAVVDLVQRPDETHIEYIERLDDAAFLIGRRMETARGKEPEGDLDESEIDDLEWDPSLPATRMAMLRD